jgi:hypothetical protein
MASFFFLSRTPRGPQKKKKKKKKKKSNLADRSLQNIIIRL